MDHPGQSSGEVRQRKTNIAWYYLYVESQKKKKKKNTNELKIEIDPPT